MPTAPHGKLKTVAPASIEYHTNLLGIEGTDAGRSDFTMKELDAKRTEDTVGA